MAELERNDSPKGKSGTLVTSGVYTDEYLSSLQGNEAAVIYSRMERSDYQVQKILAAVQNPIKSASWTIEPASEDANDLKVAAIMEQIIFKDLNWAAKLEEILTFIPRSHSVFEVINVNKQNKELGPYTGVLDIGFRDQSSLLKWNHDKASGDLISIEQKQSGDIEVEAILPAQVLLIFYNRKRGNDNGFPMLRPLYGPYKRKLMIEELKMIGIERSAIPMPMAKVPSTWTAASKEYLALLDLLASYTSGQDSYIVYPEGVTLELNSVTFDPTKLEATIKSEDEKMAGSVLAMFVELGTGGNAGALALSENLEKFFTNGIVSFANVVADTINTRLIPSLTRLNFGDAVDKFPKLIFSGIAESAGKTLMEIVTGYTRDGVIMKDAALEDHLRKVHKLPKRMDTTPPAGSQPTGVDPLTGKPLDPNAAAAPEDGGNAPEAGAPDKDAPKSGEAKLKDGGIVTKAVKEFTLSKDQVKELNLLLAEKPNSIIENKADEVKELMKDKLTLIKDKMLVDIQRYHKQLPANKKLKAFSMVNVGYTRQFKDELKAALTSVSSQALTAARKEVPGKEKVKLKTNDVIMQALDPDKTFKFNDFSKLPQHVQLLIAAQTDLIVEKQVKDLSDIVGFQFIQSSTSTDSLDLIVQDLSDAADKVINAPNIEAAATNSVATMVNETRSSFFFDPEVLEEIASFTFMNSGPVSEICKSLAGMTFNTNDAEALRYNPPLHHNCKSWLRPNLKTSRNVPEVTGLPSISQSAKKSITLSENVDRYKLLVNNCIKGNCTHD
jgi:hypothetical protein